jgi:hypothetical protein
MYFKHKRILISVHLTMMRQFLPVYRGSRDGLVSMSQQIIKDTIFAGVFQLLFTLKHLDVALLVETLPEFVALLEEEVV